MRPTTAFLLLALAATLEAGGDALVRYGIHSSSWSTRALLWLAGALVLFAYGYVVNAPPWDFGRLLGIYVVLFFVVAQVIAWVAFGQRPDRTLVVGGCFVIVGGLIMAAGSR